MKINFQVHESYQIAGLDAFSEYLKNWLTGLDYHIIELNYRLTCDEEVRRANAKFLNHDYYTDIITFDNCVGNRLQADILVSLDRVMENADDLGAESGNELLRVMIHGVLHLLGHGDGTQLEKKQMRALEDDVMKLFHVEHSSLRLSNV